MFFLLLPLTGRGKLTALIALVSYTLLIIFRNVITGLEGVPAEARDAGRGMGLTAAPAAVAGRAAAGAAGDHGRAADRGHDHGRADRARLPGRRRAASARRSSPDIQFRSNVVVAGGLCVLLAVVLDLLVLLVQKALTPWTRAAAT